MPAHEAGLTIDARNRMADRMLADIAAAKFAPESGIKLWRFVDILTDHNWGGQETLNMIADDLAGRGWRLDAARVRLATPATNLSDITARMEVEARRMDRAWMAQATGVMHEYAGKVQP